MGEQGDKGGCDKTTGTEQLECRYKSHVQLAESDLF